MIIMFLFWELGVDKIESDKIESGSHCFQKTIQSCEATFELKRILDSQKEHPHETKGKKIWTIDIK